MSIPTFPPRRDEDLLNWSTGFLEKLLASPPETFGLTAQQIATFSDLQSDFAAKLAIGTNLNSNSKANVANKNVARERMLDAPGGAWELVNVIQAHPETTDETRNELGLRVETKRSPTPIPSAPPDMTIAMTRGRIVKVRLRDIEHPENRGKPEDIYGATVVYWCGDEPDDFSQWHFARNTSRPVFDVQIPLMVLPGTKVWLSAFWFNKKMQAGPMAQPKYTRVCDGAAQFAKAA